MSIVPPFAALPLPLARRLLVGGDGPGLVPARDAALAAGDAVGPLADALCLAVWEGAPFWPEAAALTLARHAARPFMPPALVEAVRAVVAATPEPRADAYFDRLAARRDLRKMLTYLLSRQEKAPGDPTVLYRLAVFAPMLGRASDEDAALARTVEAVFAALSGPFAPLGGLTAARLALLDGRAGEAGDRCRALLAVFPADAVRQLTALAALRLGDREAARASLAGLLRARPWDTLPLHALYDLATGLAARRQTLPGTLAVLLYSYNNAALLDQALAALAATDWDFAREAGGARLFVVDNGSGDDTAAVLAGWGERLGERLRVITLPVNVGAPAARNWLAHLPEVRARDFAAYLDDDAFVPPDWLGRFGAAVDVFPEAGVWGCRILGRDAASFVQCADSHLFPTLRDGEGFGRAFDLASPWLVTPDYGQYAVCRPCATVTGCCHLFRTDVLQAVGDFDIRFSPSQYDDLDHDLRLLLAGRPPCYQGHLAVIHAKATGAASLPGGAQYGSGFANQFKLHQKYDDAAVARMADAAFAALAADAGRKWRAVRDLGLVDAAATGEGGRHDG